MKAAGRPVRSRNPLSGNTLYQVKQFASSPNPYILCKISNFIGIYKVNPTKFPFYLGKIFTPSFAYARSAFAKASSTETPVAKITPKRR